MEYIFLGSPGTSIETPNSFINNSFGVFNFRVANRGANDYFISGIFLYTRFLSRFTRSYFYFNFTENFRALFFTIALGAYSLINDLTIISCASFAEGQSVIVSLFKEDSFIFKK